MVRKHRHSPRSYKTRKGVVRRYPLHRYTHFKRKNFGSSPVIVNTFKRRIKRMGKIGDVTDRTEAMKRISNDLAQMWRTSLDTGTKALSHKDLWKLRTMMEKEYLRE